MSENNLSYHGHIKMFAK